MVNLRALTGDYLCSIKNLDMHSNFMKKGAFMLVMLLLSVGTAFGQAFTFTSGNLTHSQNFDVMDTLPNYPTGWTGVRYAGSSSTAVLLIVNNGSAASGAPYNVGTIASTERALGVLASGSTAPAIGASFVNNTGSNVGSVNISAVMEQWKSGSSAAINEVVTFEYSLDADSLNDASATWVAVSSLDMLEKLTTTTTAAAVNGNDPANQTNITGIINLAWPNATTLWVRWRDADVTGSDGMYAVDNFNMTVTNAAPATTSIVKYQVDINGLTAPNGVFIAGSFNSWNATANQMTQVGTTTVYEFTDTLNLNDTVAYKFILGGANASWENLAGACATGMGGDRQLIANAASMNLPAVAFGRCNPYANLLDATLHIDMTGQTVSANGVSVAGNFQRPTHWTPGAAMATLTTNNIYAYTIKVDPNTTYDYKFLNGNAWGTDESVPGACAVNGNRQLVIGTTAVSTSPFLFGTCNVTVSGPTDTLINIASLRGVNTDGVLDSLGRTYAIAGTVISHNIRPAGMQYVIQDNTGGFTIFRSSGNFGLGQLAVGDSIWAQGTVAQFNGLGQLSIDTAVRIAVGRPVVTPFLTSTIKAESRENTLVRINNVTLIGTNWPASGSTSNGTTVTAVSGVDTFDLRIVANGTTLGGAAPAGAFDIIGVVGQFDNSNPFTSGYQLFPRSAADIIQPATVGGPSDTLIAIGNLRGMNAAGVADSLGRTYAIQGTVISHNIRPAGMQYVIQDNTGGFTIFRSSGNFGLGALAIGDSVWAQGTVSQFNGLAQLTLDTAGRYAINRPVVQAAVVPTIKNESLENTLVRLNNVTLIGTNWPASGSTSNGTTVTAVTGVDTFDLRIVANGTNLGGAAPSGTFDIVGVVGQFDNSNPFTSGYQLFPRNAADIILPQVVVPVQVTFRVDMDTLTPGPGGVRVAGSFQGWAPNAASAVMTRIGTSSIYEKTFTINSNDTVQYKFLRDSVWSAEEQVPASCGVSNGLGGFNRMFIVPNVNVTLPAVVFGTCNPAVPPLAQRTIAQVKGINAAGVLDSLGTRQRLSGTLHGVNHYRSSSTPVGIQWIMIDHTGGITIRKAGTNFGIANLTEGDSVIVEGVMEQFNGLTQINVDTVIRVATNRTLRQPVVVTNPSEATENELIRINNLTIVSGTWPAAGVNGNLTVTNGTATFQMFLISVTNVPGSTQPSGAFDVIGFGAQNDNSNPFTDIYQIVPMRAADIIPVIVTQPTVEFQLTGDSVNVSAGPGASSMRVNIVNPVATATTVKILVDDIAPTVYGTQYSLLPAPTGDTLVLNFAASATQQLVTIIVNQNTPQGRVDSARFTIVSATGGLTIGTRNSFLLRILNPVPAAIPTRTIAQLRGANTNGIPDSVGLNVKTTGVVYGFNKRPAGLEFTIFDRTSNAGIGIFRSANVTPAYNVQEGDSIRVIGTVAHFNGLGQINVDSIVVLATNRTLVAPVVVTNFGENEESRLIRINNLSIINPAQWPIPGTTGSGNTVRVTNGVDSFDLRIDNDVDLFGTPVPASPFDAVGLGGQFDATSPHSVGYQFVPRYQADIIAGSTPVDTFRNFSLLTPANNTTLVINGSAGQTVDITWQRTFTSSLISPPVSYTWLLDLPNGDFSAPLASMPSNAGGFDTSLTLTFGMIDTLLQNNGVNVGVTVPLKWTVRASQTGGAPSKLATVPFNITLTRGQVFPISVEENQLFQAVQLYPNPATDKVYIRYELLQTASIKLEVVNMLGKVVSTENIAASANGLLEMEVTNLPEGVYFARMTGAQSQLVKRFVVKH